MFSFIIFVRIYIRYEIIFVILLCARAFSSILYYTYIVYLNIHQARNNKKKRNIMNEKKKIKNLII